MSQTRVTHVEMNEWVNEPPKWTFEVTRFGTGGILPYPPSASDVPPDIRAGLRAWLDTAEGES